MSSPRRGARPVRVVPNRLSRLRRRRRLARLAGVCTLVASAALIQGAMGVSIQPAAEVSPIALRLDAAGRPASGPTPAEAALREGPGPSASFTVAAATRATAALLAPPAKAAGRTGVLPAVAVTHPFSAAEADHALAGLDLDPATRRELKRLLMTVPEPPPAG
jgi:hypothetical protein